jgi:hypothetical protein
MVYKWGDAKYKTKKTFNEAIAQDWIGYVSALVKEGCAQCRTHLPL